MRQIEKMMVRAFNAGENFHLSNTSVSVNETAWDYKNNRFTVLPVAVRLHGNLIAYKDKTGVCHFSAGGWHTVTTSSRLRALGAPVCVRGGRIVHSGTGCEIWHSFRACGFVNC